MLSIVHKHGHAWKNCNRVLQYHSRSGKTTNNVEQKSKLRSKVMGFDMVNESRSTYSKRKVALVCSYVGTGYYGLQISDNSKLPTIEYELKEALIKSGCISESNAINLSKIAWSRSSRTDKGVHAARIVISAKLEIKNEYLPPVNVVDNDFNLYKFHHIKQIPPLINQYLPKNIQIISCIRVNKGFRARESCAWREYEYHFPASILTKNIFVNKLKDNENDKKNGYNIHNLPYHLWKHDSIGSEGNSSPVGMDISTAVDKLNKALKKMEGSHSFHNFHRLGAKALRDNYNKNETVDNNSNDKRTKNNDNNLRIVEDFSDEEEDENNEEEEEIINNHQDFELADKVPIGLYTNIRMESNVYDFVEGSSLDWIPKDRSMLNKEDMICIRIRGSSFLLHQIRLMVSAALLTVHGIVPEYAIDAALQIPYFIHFPIAPSEGLVLVNSGFVKNNIIKKDFFLTSTFKNYDKDSFELLDESENEASKAFSRSHIIPTIISNWFQFDNYIIKDFFNKVINYYNMPYPVGNKFKSLYDSNLINNETVAIAHEQARINDRIARFQLSLDQQYDSIEEACTYAYANIKDNKHNIMQYKYILPNTIYTSLAVRFNTVPNKLIGEALRALATQLAFGKIKPNSSLEELVDIIVMSGNKELGYDGLEYWALKQPKHPWII
eukprot:gene4650-6534_t